MAVPAYISDNPAPTSTGITANDYGVFTNEELRSQIERLSKTPSTPDQNQFRERIKSFLKSRLQDPYYNRFPDNLSRDVDLVYNYAVNNGNIGGGSDQNYLKTSADALKNEWNSLVQEYDLGKKNSIDDIYNINQILASRGEKQASEQDVTDYLTALPEELQASREKFLAGQQESAKARFEQDIAPQALASANVRGALFSGDVPDLLTSNAIDVQSALDQARADLESQDNQFYFNAAYSNAIRKALESNINLSDFLTNQRQGVLQEQSNRFSGTQSSLDQILQNQLYRNQADRQLRLQSNNLQRQQEQDRAARNKQNSAQIGQLAGTLIGAYGGAGGAAIGGEQGKQIGGSLG